jgi:hypothetical protein
MRGSNGVQLFENNSVIQREIVEEVIEEALGWQEQGSKQMGRTHVFKKHTGLFETLGNKIQVEVDKDGEEQRPEFRL